MRQDLSRRSDNDAGPASEDRSAEVHPLLLLPRDVSSPSDHTEAAISGFVDQPVLALGDREGGGLSFWVSAKRWVSCSAYEELRSLLVVEERLTQRRKECKVIALRHHIELVCCRGRFGVRAV